MSLFFPKKEIFEGFTINGPGSQLESRDLEQFQQVFIPTSHMKFGFKWPRVFLRKRSSKMLNLIDFGQRSVNDLVLELS